MIPSHTSFVLSAYLLTAGILGVFFSISLLSYCRYKRIFQRLKTEKIYNVPSK